jgi:hypothetical protein
MPMVSNLPERTMPDLCNSEDEVGLWNCVCEISIAPARTTTPPRAGSEVASAKVPLFAYAPNQTPTQSPFGVEMSHNSLHLHQFLRWQWDVSSYSSCIKRASVVRHLRCGSGGLGTVEPGGRGGLVVWCGGCGFFGLGPWFGVWGLLDMWEKLKGEE